MKLSHAETQALVSARLDGPLDPVAERELNTHLATCESCRAFNASATRLARGLQALPYLPASPAVTRAVLDHVSAPRSPISWLTGSMPPNALPAASAIAAAVIVVFLGSFAAFRFLDEEEPETIPASTQSVTDLAQSVAETAEATQTDIEAPPETVDASMEDMEAQTFVTEEADPPTDATESAPATEEVANLRLDATEAPSDSAAQLPPPTDEPASEPSESGTGGQAPESAGQDATEIGPPPPNTEEPPPTDVPTETVSPTPVPSLRALLGLVTQTPIDDGPEPTAVPTDEPTTIPTDVPTAIPTDVPTAIPTDVPTAIPTDAPTAIPATTLAPEPTDEPESTESASDLQILGPSGDAVTEASSEPATAPPQTATTVPPNATLEPEPTPVPTDVPEPTPTPIPTDVPEPTTVPTATVVPIVSNVETPEENGEDADDSVPESPGDDAPDLGPEVRADDDDGDDSSDNDGDDSSDDDGEGSSGGDDRSEQTILPSDSLDDQESSGDDDQGGQTILPTDGLEDAGATPEDAIAAPADIDDDSNDDDSSSSQITSDTTSDGDSASLSEADIVQSVEDVPGDESARLGLSADGELLFSSNPGRVSLSQNGITLETADGPTGQVVLACDGDDSCVDISSASSSGGTNDSPIGWLDGQVIYERLRGDDFPVEFRAIAIDQGSVEDRLIGGGGSDLETMIQSYPVDGGLLVTVPAGWLFVSTSSVEVIDDFAAGQDVSLIRVDQSSGFISYVSVGSLILAATSSPGSPVVQVPFAGSDYDFSPDGSRIAVVTGAGIEIQDTAGNVLATYPNDDGIVLGSLTWLTDGLVFVDLTSGVLRVIRP